jgi:hypothetical protein
LPALQSDRQTSADRPPAMPTGQNCASMMGRLWVSAIAGIGRLMILFRRRRRLGTSADRRGLAPLAIVEPTRQYPVQYPVAKAAKIAWGCASAPWLLTIMPGSVTVILRKRDKEKRWLRCARGGAAEKERKEAEWITT